MVGMGKGFLIASEAYVDVNASSYLAGCLLAELFTPLDGVATDTNMRKVGHELLLSESIDGKMSEKTETATARGGQRPFLPGQAMAPFDQSFITSLKR